MLPSAPLLRSYLTAPASTLTVTVDGGNLNENFFVLIPAETIPVSSVTFPSTYPDGTALYQNTNTFTFESTSPDPISPSDMTAIVTATNLWGQGSVTTLTVNHGLAVTDNSGGAKTDWLGSFPLETNTIYSIYIQAFDLNGIPATTTVRFDTINPNSYTFEAEDYNYTDANGNPGSSSIIRRPMPIPGCLPQTGLTTTSSPLAATMLIPVSHTRWERTLPACP